MMIMMMLMMMMMMMMIRYSGQGECGRLGLHGYSRVIYTDMMKTWTRHRDHWEVATEDENLGELVIARNDWKDHDEGNDDVNDDNMAEINEEM